MHGSDANRPRSSSSQLSQAQPESCLSHRSDTSVCQAMVRVKYRTSPTQALHKNRVRAEVCSFFTQVSENASNRVRSRRELTHNERTKLPQLHAHIRSNTPGLMVFVTYACIAVHREYPALALECRRLACNNLIWICSCNENILPKRLDSNCASMV